MKANPLRGKRICKDVLCCIIFGAFIALLGFIFGLGIAAGDWEAVLYDADYLGDRCGVDGRPKKAFYPRIAKDLVMQADKVATGQYWDLHLYALCVDECPKDFNIQNPEVVTDYGYNPASAVTQALGDGTQATWISATPTADLLNRCVPRVEQDATSEKMCAYPNCTAPEAVALGAVCATNPDFGPSWVMSTLEQKRTCIVEAKQTKNLQYQMASEDDAAGAALATIAGHVGGFFEVVTALREGIMYILAFGILGPIVVAVLYMVLLYLFTKTIIYGLLTILVFVEILATLVCFVKSDISIAGLNGEDLVNGLTGEENVTLADPVSAALGEIEGGSSWIYTAGFWVLIIITIITVLTIVAWRKKIAICAMIIKEATTVFKDVPSLMIFPVFTSMVQVLVCAWAVTGLILLRTTKAESFDLVIQANTTSIDPLDGFLRDVSESGNLKMAMIIIHLYGFFTIYQWVGGMSWTTMACTTGWWYYFKGDDKNKSRFPLLRSLFIMSIFHTGSVAFAAFVIAFFDLLRVIVAYIQRQMAAAGQNGTMMKLAFCCLGCCISCIQRTVKMISYYGLVFVATNGQSFCSACWSTAKFFVKHAGQVTVNGIVIWLIKMISVFTSPITCAMIGFFACESAGIESPMYPAIAIFCCSVLMTTACMNVFDCTITTIFVCCFEDQEKYESRYMLQPHHKALASVFNKKRGKDKEAATAPDPEKDKLVEA